MQRHDNSPDRNFLSVKKHSSKILPNFSMYDQSATQQAHKSSQRRQSSAVLTSKNVDLAASGCFDGSLESERITNPKAYETMFAVAQSSKFGGMKKRSQVL